MKKIKKVIINVTLVLMSAVAFAGPDHLRTPDAYDNAVWTEYGQKFVAEGNAIFGVSFYMKNNNGAPGPFEIAVYELPDSENPIKLHEFSSDGSGLDGLVEVSFDSHVLTTAGSNYLFTIKRSTTDTYDIGLYSLSDSYLDGDTAVRLNDGTMAFNESKRDLSFSIDSGEGDSDGDGLSDGDEVITYGTDPNDADSDDDGLNDYDEVFSATSGVYWGTWDDISITFEDGSSPSRALLNPEKRVDALVTDSNGILYAATRDEIIKITPDGTQIDFNGDQSLLGNEIAGSGLVIDSLGNLYVSNYEWTGAANIIKIGTNGIASIFATIPGGGALAVDAEDNIFAASYFSGEIRKITSAGDISLFADVGGTGSANSMAFDSSGNLFVSQQGYGGQANLIRKITPEKDIEVFWDSGSASNPYMSGVTVDENDNIYAGLGSTIYKLDSDGAATVFVAGLPESFSLISCLTYVPAKTSSTDPEPDYELTLYSKNIRAGFFNESVSINNAIGTGCRVEMLWSSTNAVNTVFGNETNLISTVTGSGVSDSYGFGYWSSSSITRSDLPEESGYVWVRVYNKSETYYIDLGELDISSTIASLDKDTVLRIPDSSRIKRSYVMERDGINNPLADNDGDGLNNRYEIENGLDPNDADSDNDGLTDGDEVLLHNSNPLSEDTDNDGIEDGLEASHAAFGLDININSSNVVNFIQDMNRMKPEWRGEGMTLDESKIELVKLRPGSKAVDVSNGTARIRMKLEQSSDLMMNWTNRVDKMEVDLPASKDVLFYRIRTD